MTAEELIKEKDYWFFETLPGNQDTFILKENISELMIKFAKYHVEKALEEASEKARIKENWWQDNGNPNGFAYTTVDKKSILNAYSLNKII